ncbi:MAG: hypothetical protein LBL50_05220 [Candidatus Margulisbacteria bacterium]|jgi:hypothetical protein|nr:hypothetical protein [Candidatus Margulisiibacteriota bacterium]
MVNPASDCVENNKLAAEVITVIDEEDIKYLELLENEIACARQAMRPDVLPGKISRDAAERVFQEAIFACADAQYLKYCTGKEIATQYNLQGKNWHIDIISGKLLLEKDTK